MDPIPRDESIKFNHIYVTLMTYATDFFLFVSRNRTHTFTSTRKKTRFLLSWAWDWVGRHSDNRADRSSPLVGCIYGLHIAWIAHYPARWYIIGQVHSGWYKSVRDRHGMTTRIFTY